MDNFNVYPKIETGNSSQKKCGKLMARNAPPQISETVMELLHFIILQQEWNTLEKTFNRAFDTVLQQSGMKMGTRAQ